MNPSTKNFILRKKLFNLPQSSFLKTLFLRAFTLSSLLFATHATAQKQPLNHDVYDDWQSIGSVNISPNGKWSVYNVNPQEGDSWLYIQATQQQHSKQKIHRAEKASITTNSKHVVFSIKPFYKEIKENRVQKNKKGEKKDEKKLTKDTLGIYNLSDHQLIKIPEVLSFKLPEKNGDYLAYIREVEKKSEDTTKSKKKETYKQLVIRDLKNNKEVNFDNVEDYIFSKNGAYLAYTLKNEKKKSEKKEKEDETAKTDEAETDKTEVVLKQKEGVYLVSTKTMQEIAVTDKEGIYSKLKFNEDSNLLAFIATHDKEKEDVKKYAAYLYSVENQQLSHFDNDLNGIPTDWVISENYTPEFSKNSKRLYLGIAPKKEAKDTTFIEEDHAILDIWHYKDETLQTQQLVNLKRELERSYLSVVHLDQPDRLVPLQDEKMNYVRLVNEGDADFVFGMSDYGHRIERQWQGSGISSYYIIDTKTGAKKEVLKNLDGNVSVSPEGKNIVFFDRTSSNWYAYDIASEKITHLNKDLNVSFANEQHDSPSLAPPYALIGWSKDDASVWIKDRYDIWKFDLKTNQAPKNITHFYGRENKTSFNYLKFDKEARHIATDKKIILTAFQEDDKQSGFYELYKNRKPKKLAMAAMSGHRSLIKAEESEDYLFTQQSFVIPPTLVSSKNLKHFTALHQSNPQQKDYNWGTVELIHYTAQNGKPATGMLYKPEDFDATKKYPLLSYFYERRSDDLHSYEAPAPTPSRLNITYFVSNGYLVFVPDIEYTEGYPGRSAEEYVDAGIDYLKTFDFVNGNKIGIQGQSWGGYQVAHLITRSDRYAAAWAGAPVVNMTSAYGGIRWSTGMNRQFQYEKTQSRIGKNLWDGYDLYIENSPLFHLENVNTPVAIMHNDKDGAVPWYQGIEMFTALRRLGKPVWLLNYNNDEHNLIKRQNRKDIQRREQQFFDHYLKDAPAPEWMVHGIPATKKGKTWGFELTDETP